MAGGMDNNEGGAISGINVTPLVDVMLVLLVIFMVTAPMIQQGLDVQLPAASGTALTTEVEAPLVVSVTQDGAVYLNDTRTEAGVLATRIRAILEEKPDQVVYVRGDGRASYAAVVGVIGSLHAGGIYKVGLITEPGSG